MMVRSLWIRTLATTLVWTGVTWAQQSTYAPDDKKADQILTIQEKGKSPQMCKVINTWRTSDGYQAYQVRALDTGEMLTITEKITSTSTYGTKPPSVATQIFHWGPGQVSPTNAPTPPGTSATAAVATATKQRVQTSGSPYALQGADSVKSMVPSPYSSTNKLASQPEAGAKNITLPEPEKDWRQSWAKAEEKPLRIEDKPSTKDSIADAPRLRIEGKPPPKEAAFDLSATKRPGPAQPKVALTSDDPLLHPDLYMPKVLDVTPLRKAADANAVQLPGGPSPARAPTIADLAGSRTEQKAPAALDKPMVAFDTGKMPAPAMPVIAQPTLVPMLPSATDKLPVTLDFAKKESALAPVPTAASTQPVLVPTLPPMDKPMAVTDADKAPAPAVPPAMPVNSQPVLVPTLPPMDKPIAVTDEDKTPALAVPPAMPVISQPAPAAPPLVDSPAIVIDAGRMPIAVTPPKMPVIIQPNIVTALPSFEDKPGIVIETGKLGGAVSMPALPAIVQPDITPKPVLDTPKVAVDHVKTSGPVIIPELPDMVQPTVIPAEPIAEKKPESADSADVGRPATISSTPVIPQAPVVAMAPPVPLAVAPPSVSRVPLPPMPETRAERPSFLIMNAGGSAAPGHSIILPGVPNAVVAFGQPVTLTSPPPDMVRKKSLEEHSVRTMLGHLKDSLFPSQREWAAEGLTSANWKIHPEVIEALCTAALEDPATSVRVRCIKSLAAMNPRSETALRVVRKLQSDKDELVHAEADEAFKVLGIAEIQP